MAQGKRVPGLISISGIGSGSTSRTQVGIDGTGRALATAARVGCDSARRGVTLRVERDLSRRVSRLSSHYHPILTP